MLVNLYRILLHLYPSSFRHEFGDEMLQVFASMAAERRAGFSRFVFGCGELLGLVAGAALERLAPGRAGSDDLPVPSDVAGAEKYARIMSQRLIHAIANHNFPNARLYDVREREARAILARLRCEAK